MIDKFVIFSLLQLDGLRLLQEMGFIPFTAQGDVTSEFSGQAAAEALDALRRYGGRVDAAVQYLLSSSGSVCSDINHDSVGCIKRGSSVVENRTAPVGKEGPSALALRRASTGPKQRSNAASTTTAAKAGAAKRPPEQMDLRTAFGLSSKFARPT